MLKTRQITITVFALIILFGCGTHKPQFKDEPFEKHTKIDGTGFTQKRLYSLTNFLNNNLEKTESK